MEKNCTSCGTLFVTNRRYQRYCSARCSGHDRQARYRERQPKRAAAKMCNWCLTKFEHHDGRRIYCSQECADIGGLLREVQGKYGISKAEYRDMWIKQDGLCAVCRQPERVARCRLLCVDHDHATGRIRGLLCNACNRGIGLLGDDPETLIRASVYLDPVRPPLQRSGASRSTAGSAGKERQDHG